MTQERQAVDLWVSWLLLPVPSAAMLLAPPPPLPETQQPPSIDHLLPSSFFAPSQTPVYSATQPNGHKHRTESFLFFCFQNYYSRHSNKKKKASTERHRELPKKKTHYTKIKNLFQRNITDNISHIFLKNKQTANSEHFTSPLRYRVYYYYYYYYYYYHFLVLWVM